jgi:hypothetical protein
MDYGVPLHSWTQVVSRHGSQPIEKEGVTTYCKRAVRFADRRKLSRCLITLLLDVSSSGIEQSPSWPERIATYKP